MAIHTVNGNLRIYHATSKSNRRKWSYHVKDSWNTRYYSFAGDVLQFRRTLWEAKQIAVEAGDFRYNDEPPTVRIVK
jgi:hypothetical protein